MEKYVSVLSRFCYAEPCHAKRGSASAEGAKPLARGVQGPATRAPGGGPGGKAPWKPSDFWHMYGSGSDIFVSVDFINIDVLQ